MKKLISLIIIFFISASVVSSWYAYRRGLIEGAETIGSEPAEVATLIDSIHKASVIVTGIIGPSFSSGGGTSSTVSIKQILLNLENQSLQKEIGIGYPTSKASYNNSKTYFWFLKSENDGKLFKDVSSFPMVEATDENIAYLKACLRTTKRDKLGAPPNGSPFESLTKILHDYTIHPPLPAAPREP